MPNNNTSKDPHQHYRYALNKIDDAIIKETGKLIVVRPRIPMEERGWKDPLAQHTLQSTNNNGKPEPHCDLVLVVGVFRQLWRFHATRNNGVVHASVPPRLSKTPNSLVSLHGVHIAN